MRKYVFFTVLLIICMIFLSASSVPEIQSIERLVPDTAFFYLNILNMDDFLTGLESFMQPLGLKATLGKDAIKKRMQEMITEEGGNFKIDGLDFKKPWSFAVLPSQNKSDPLFEVIIPLVNAQKNFEPFKAFVNKLDKVDMKRDGDFAIIFPSGKMPQTFPPKKSIDLKEIESYPKASVSCWIGVKQAMKAFGVDTKTLETMLSGALSESESPSEGAAKLLSGVIGLIDEIESITYDLQADKAGLAVRSSIRVTKGKSIDGILKPLSSAKGLTAYAKYLPPDYFFTMSAHTDPDFTNRLMKSAYIPLIEALDLASKDKAEIIALMNKIGAIKTSEMSVAFDFDIDFAALSELGGLSGSDSEDMEDYKDYEQEEYDDSGSGDSEYSEESEDYEDSGNEGYTEEKSTPSPEEMQKIIDTIGKSIKINIAGAMDLKEKDKYRALMDEFAKSQVFNKIVNSYLKELGVEGVQLKYSINYAKDKKAGSFTYDEFAFNMDLVETAKAGNSSSGDIEEMKMAMQIIKPFFDRYKLLLHYENDKCYMAMGEDAVGMLTKLVKTDSFPSPNLSDAIKANPKLKELYDSSQLGSTMSIIKYINLLRSAPGLQMIPELKSTGKEVGIIGGMKYADGKIESTGYWGMDEIKRLFDAVNKTLQIDKMLSL